MNKVIGFVLSFCIALNCSANGLDEVFRSNQKYYVAVAVLAIIFAGIVVFLVALEKRLKKLEK